MISPRLKRIAYLALITAEIVSFLLLFGIWLLWSIGGEAPTKFIYYNF